MPEKGQRKVKPRKTMTAEMLTRARQQKGYSQQEMAFFCGIALRHYQRIELGERPFSALNMRQGLIICILLEIDPVNITFCEENFSITTDSR